MIELLKPYRKILITLLFPYLYILMLLTLPTRYAVTAPGGLTNNNQFFEIDGYTLNDQFHTVHVFAYNRMTPFLRLILDRDERMDVFEMSPTALDISLIDEYKMGQVSKLVSYKNAVIAAYNQAAETHEHVSIDYHYAGYLIYYRASDLRDLEIGDRIIGINGISYLDATASDFSTLIQNETELVFDVQRDHQVFTVNYEREDDRLTLSLYHHYEIDQTTPTISMPGLDSPLLGGPSGGLMQALAIYVSLVEVRFGNLKIAGTGTISMLGNVGRIGGLQQKLYTGFDQKIDIFIVPSMHKNDDLNWNFPFIILYANTLSEAVELLYEATHTNN